MATARHRLPGSRESPKGLHVHRQIADVRIGPLVISMDSLRIVVRAAGHAEALSSCPRRRKTARRLARTLRQYPRGPCRWAGPPGGNRLLLRVRLQLPHVDIEQCIGCGICENACPIAGLRGIRVSCENESRDPRRTLVL